MRQIRHAVLIAIPVVLLGCSESSTLFGTPGTSSGGTGGSAGSGSTSTSSSSSSGSSGSGGSGAGTSSSGSGGSGAGGSSSGTGGTDCTPVGHDEDGDTVDDGCDNCPTYANDTQVDGDQDDVGDVCEASWDSALWQTVASFDAFVTAPGSAWELGDYTHAGDALGITTPSNTGRNADWLTSQSGNYSVETTFTYENDEAAWAGLRFAISGPAWWACLVQREWMGTGYGYSLGLWEFPGTGNQVLLRAETQDIGSEPAERPRRVRVHVRPGGSVLCTYDDTDGQQGEVEYQVSNADGLVGLRAYDTDVHFLNFVTYQ